MKKILVVDDSKVITDLVRLMLAKSEYGCAVANSANECVRLLRKEKFDLVLLDIAMPDVSGLDVLDMIKNDATQRSTRVVLFTASSPTDTELQAFVARGALGVIKKPVKKESLIAQVDTYLSVN